MNKKEDLIEHVEAPRPGRRPGEEHDGRLGRGGPTTTTTTTTTTNNKKKKKKQQIVIIIIIRILTTILYVRAQWASRPGRLVGLHSLT